MEQQPSPIFGPNIGKTALRTAIAVAALLLLQGIVDALPMLKNSSPILGDSLLTPILLCNVIIDTVIILVLLTFGLRLGRSIQTHGQKFAPLGKILTQLTVVLVLILAYKVYELPAACSFVGRSDLVNLGASVNGAQANSNDFMRLWGQMVSQVSAQAIQNATGDALIPYQQLAVAVFRRSPDLYAWIFVILIAIPVVSLIPLVHRNLDAIVELFFPGTTTLQSVSVPATGTSPISAPQTVIERPPDLGPGITLRELLEKIGKLKILVDSHAITAADFDNQKKKFLAQPRSLSQATEPVDFMKLKDLQVSGALTQEEFETQKQRSLDQL
jgi:hypothetical protein